MSEDKEFLVRELVATSNPAEKVLSFNTNIVIGHEDAANYRYNIYFRGNMESFALGQIEGKDVIATTSEEPGGGAVEIRIWDAFTGRLVRRPFEVDSEVGCPIAIGRADGDDVIIVGGTGEIAIWRASTDCIKRLPTFRSYSVASGIGAEILNATSYGIRQRLSRAPTLRSDGVTLTLDAVAIGRLGNRDVVVGSMGKAVFIWDMRTGQLTSELLTCHDGAVEAVAIGRAGGHDLIVTGSADRTVMLHWHQPQKNP